MNKKIKLPKHNHKRALFLIDLQHGFIKCWDKSVISNIKSLIAHEKYDLYVEATFHTEKDSQRDNQRGWVFPWEPTIPEIQTLLRDKKTVKIVKETSSVFKGNKNLLSILHKNKIKEVHIIGFDTNDCVFASAQESFDNGFFTYVIEECTGSSGGQKLHNSAIYMLRYLKMTNHRG